MSGCPPCSSFGGRKAPSVQSGMKTGLTPTAHWCFCSNAGRRWPLPDVRRTEAAAASMQWPSPAASGPPSTSRGQGKSFDRHDPLSNLVVRVVLNRRPCPNDHQTTGTESIEGRTRCRSVRPIGRPACHTEQHLVCVRAGDHEIHVHAPGARLSFRRRDGD